MKKASTVEIRYCDSELVVSPTSKGINRRNLFHQLASEVSAALEVPREDLVTDVVVDLERVTWIGSAGLNELISLQTHVRSVGVGLRIRSANEMVREVFRITRLERSFEFGTAESSARELDSAELQSSVSR